jgi:hypothetical protein
MWTDPTWMQQGLDALRSTLDTDPAMRRDMVQFLLDEGFWSTDTLRTWDSAVARFNSCLNPHKSEFFKLSELWALMKRFHRHQLFLAMAADLGYEVRPLPTEARRQALLERIAVGLERCGWERDAVHAELARLEAHVAAPGPRIEPAVREGTARFSLPPEPKATF